MAKRHGSGQTIGHHLMTFTHTCREQTLGWEFLFMLLSPLCMETALGLYHLHVQKRRLSYMSILQQSNLTHLKITMNGRSTVKFKQLTERGLYDYLCALKPDVVWYDAVWISRAIPRHSFHTWLVIQDRLPTRDRLLKWGLQVEGRCLLCNSNPESRDHLFFSCNYSYDLWAMVARRLQLVPSRHWPITIQQLIALPPPASQRILTRLAWQATLYWLWTERNTRLHTQMFRSVDQIFKLLDRQLKNKLQSFRDTNRTRSSIMMQSWFRFG